MNTPFFDKLIDSFGIWQHTDGDKPLFEHGYALDDATRGLLFCIAEARQDQADILFDYIVRSQKGSDFYGFANGDHQFFDYPASEDAKGQAVWAMGYAVGRNFRSDEAKRLLKPVVPSLSQMRSLRGPAYALLGALHFDKPLADSLQRTVAARFDNLTGDWFWPEGKLTYANGIMPYALLRYALVYGDKPSEALGRTVLDFVERCCTTNRIRGPIGYEDWYARGATKPADDGQQAIDAAYMIWAWMAAYQLSGNTSDLDKAATWMQWFEGENIAHARMYDAKTLKTFDGINLHANDDHHNARGINYHSGAESNICLILTKRILETQETL